MIIQYKNHPCVVLEDLGIFVIALYKNEQILLLKCGENYEFYGLHKFEKHIKNDY